MNSQLLIISNCEFVLSKLSFSTKEIQPVHIRISKTNQNDKKCVQMKQSQAGCSSYSPNAHSSLSSTTQAFQ